jgi:hypothetical protein
MILKPLSNIEHINQLTLDASFSQPVSQLHNQFEQLAQRQQWIMFTAQCPRSDIVELAVNHHCADKIVHLMPSRSLSEFDVVEKAIRSNNASAIVASNRLTQQQQEWLTTLAQLHHCQLFFIESQATRLH